MKYKLKPRKPVRINPRRWHEQFVFMCWTDDHHFVFWDWVWQREVPCQVSVDYGARLIPGWKWERRAEKPDNLMAQGGH